MIGLGTLLRLAQIHSVVGLFEVTFPRLNYTVTPTWLDDPEPNRTVAFNENRFGVTWELDSSGDLGNTFASKYEFPWIVDIRSTERIREQSYWSTGNLISEFKVFTTCRAIDDLGNFKTAPPGNMAYVSFGQMYIFEYANRDEHPTDWKLGGRRTVVEAKKHPKCNIRKVQYDGGILTIRPTIKPYNPIITTIPLTLNYYDGQLPGFDLSRMDEQIPGRRHGRVCYVASIGRDYNNIIDTMVKDYKVKYRVYWQKPDFCRERRDKLCPNRHLTPSDCEIGSPHPDEEGKELMCFQSRQKVGTVCDHDRGAPLVCDGVVFGIVVVGAKPAYCSSVLPLPFWVQKVTVFKEYFEPVKRSRTGIFVRSASTTQSSPKGLQGFLLILLACTLWTTSRLSFSLNQDQN